VSSERGAAVRLEFTLGATICIAAASPRGALDRMNATMPADPPAPAPAPSRTDDGQGAAVAERQEQRTEPPRLFQVVMLNDDYTPMEFVVFALQEYFQRDIETATLIMLKIHHEGRGVCGVYTKDVAATKVELVLAAARRAGHPLQCTMEAA
jgi:ATP-dependent Clp protease adaptor protein ClpS